MRTIITFLPHLSPAEHRVLTDAAAKAGGHSRLHDDHTRDDADRYQRGRS